MGMGKLSRVTMKRNDGFSFLGAALYVIGQYGLGIVYIFSIYQAAKQGEPFVFVFLVAIPFIGQLAWLMHQWSLFGPWNAFSIPLTASAVCMLIGLGITSISVQLEQRERNKSTDTLDWSHLNIELPPSNPHDKDIPVTSEPGATS